ncbi:MAG: portal protein [Planctomycetota bacterium]|jgi:hypothetical protein
MADVLGDKKNNPGKDEDDFLAELRTEEENGMKVTSSWASMWQESLRYFFSDQLHGKKIHEDWDWIIVNYIWPSAIQEICKLAKNYPKILAHPWEDSDTDAAETWQSALQWIWEKGLRKGGMRLEQIKACLCGKIFGYRISKIYWEDRPDGAWDDKKKIWVGDVKHRLWHPAEFWASDREYIDEGNCGTVRYVDLAWAQHRWPDFKAQLKNNATSYQEAIKKGGHVIRGQVSSAGTYPSSGRGGIDKGMGTNDPSALLQLILQSDKMSGQQSVREEEREFVKISEQYRKNYDTTNEKLEGDVPEQELIDNGTIIPDNGQFLDAKTKQPFPRENWPRRIVQEWKQPKYPYGQHVIRNEDVILNPDNQRYPYSRWPFIVTPHYLLPFMWQGVDAVQLYKSNQDMINVTVSHLVNNMKKFGDPRVLLETGAMAINPKTKKAFKVFSGAGSIIRLVKGAISRKAVSIVPPVPIGGGALQLYQLFSQEYKNMVGLQDISQGKKPPGEMSATESQYLALSSNDRIYLQSVFEDEWVRQIATLVAEICQDKYDADRFIRIVGEDKVIGTQQITQKMKTIRMDIDVEPGQTLPFDEQKRDANYEKAYAMLSQPMVNPMLPEMMRNYGITNWRKILQKHEAWILFFQFNQLYQAVKERKITPEQAIQMIIQAAKQRFEQDQNTVEGIEARNTEKGEFDKKQLAIDRDRGKLKIEEAVFQVKKQGEKKKKAS